MDLSALKAALETRLPGPAMRIEPSRHVAGGEVIVIPAAHADVGDVLIEDARDELTMYIGRITYVHFGGLDDGRSAEEQANAVAADVAKFLDALLAERVLMWTAWTAAGWRLVDAPVTAPRRSWWRRFYVWSGPL